PRGEGEGLRCAGLFTAKVVKVLQLSANEGCQPMARWRKGDCLSVPARQFRAEELLEFPDLPAEKALAHGVVARRAHNRPRVGNREKTSQPVKGETGAGKQFRKHDLIVMPTTI